MRKIKGKLILIAVLFANTVVVAQTGKIAGTIKDSVSKKVLANATIFISSNQDNFQASENSDSLGQFQFKSIKYGSYRMKVNFVGYADFIDKQISISQNDSLSVRQILLRPTEAQKKDVVVNSKVPFIQQTPDKISLNIASSPIAAGGNVYDAILRTPGMAEQNGELNFRMQGSVEVLINGRPSTLPADHIKDVLLNMQASRVEKIEVLPNPSAKYNGTAGTIVNIILIKNQDYGTNYTFTGGIGTGKYLTGNTGLDFNYRNQYMNVYGGYNFEHNKQYYKDVTNSILKNYSITSDETATRSRKNNTYNLGTDFYLNKQSTIGFMINGYYNLRARNVSDNSVLRINKTDSSSSVITSGKAKFSSPAVNVYYQTKFDSLGNSLSINLDYFNYNQHWTDNFITTYFDDIPPTYMRDQSPSNNNVYAVSADFTHPTKKTTWEFGIRSSYTKTDNNILWQNLTNDEWVTDIKKTNYFIYKENINAAYINYSRQIKKVRLQLGLRAEQTNTTGNLITTKDKRDNHYFNLFPTVNLMYMRNQKNIFSLAYKGSIYRFDYNYVNPFIVYQNQYTYSQGNPDIQPMLFNKISLNYIYNQILSVNLGYTHVKHMISLEYMQGENNTLIQTYGNLNYGNYYTLNITLQKQLGIWQAVLSGLGGYAHYVNSKAASLINNSFMGRLQWQNNFNFKGGWSIEENSAYSAPIASGSAKIGALFNTGIGVSKTLWKGDGSIKLSVSDVFNTAKPDIRYKNVGIITNTDINNETRFVNLTFKYKFGNKHVKDKKARKSGVSDLLNRMGN